MWSQKCPFFFIPNSRAAFRKLGDILRFFKSTENDCLIVSMDFIPDICDDKKTTLIFKLMYSEI